MAGFRFKVAYTTDPSNIEPALSAGTINEGDLIIVNQDGKGSLRFITKGKEILSFSDVTQTELETKVQETVDQAISWTDQ